MHFKVDITERKICAFVAGDMLALTGFRLCPYLVILGF
jgi:hypothetical protein